MVVGTIVSLLLVDRVGRRPLLIEGGVQVPNPYTLSFIPSPLCCPLRQECVFQWNWVLGDGQPLHAKCIFNAPPRMQCCSSCNN